VKRSAACRPALKGGSKQTSPVNRACFC